MDIIRHQKIIYCSFLLFAALLLFFRVAFAATETITIIREDCAQKSIPTANCYMTLSAWEAGEQRDLTANDEIAVAQIEGAWANFDSSAASIKDWTTTATNYIKIQTIGSARHSGKWTDTAYRRSASLAIYEGYVNIDGVQVEVNGSSGWPTGINHGGTGAKAGVVNISNVIIRGGNLTGASGGRGITEGVSVSVMNIWNTVIYNLTSAGIFGNNSLINVYNTTVYNTYQGIRGISGGVVKNCVTFGNANNDFYYMSGATIDHCASDDGGGTNPIIISDWTQVFIDYLNGDFHLKSTDTSLKDAGVSDPASGFFSADIDGQTRSGSWDIGADEYSMAASQCSDSIDNDSDSLIDYPSDPGCSSSIDNDETNATPPPEADTTPPSIPQNLQSTSISSTYTIISWQASIDNTAIAGYKIYRNGTQITTTQSTSYTSTGLTPQTQYIFTVSAYDSAGNESLQSSPLSITTQSQGSYTPPIGIPAPSFGINETVESVYGNSNYYTYYIDNTVNCSDDTSTAANNYGKGTVALPRCTIPSITISGGVRAGLDVVPGDVIVIVAGEYSPSRQIAIRGGGSVVSPVFIRGKNASSKPVIKGTNMNANYRGITTELASTGYIILENIIYNNVGVELVSPANGSISNLVLRNSEIKNVEGRNNGVDVGTRSHSTLSNVVVYNNLIHDIGRGVLSDYDEDAHAVYAGIWCTGCDDSNISNVWILNNEMYNYSGDGTQINVMSTTMINQLHHVYVGKNTAHNGKQYGLFTKQASDVIFSENTVYGFRPSSSSMGGGLGLLYGPQRIWFLFNKIYDANLGLRSGEDNFAGLNGPSTDIYMIGNVVYDIHRIKGDAGVTSGAWRSGTGIQIWSDVNAMKYLIGNTIYDADAGISSANWAPLDISNNIVKNIKEAHVEIERSSTASLSRMMNNLFDSPLDTDSYSPATQANNIQTINQVATNVPAFCARADYFEYQSNSAVLGETTVGGAVKSAITVSGANFASLGVRAGDRISITASASVNCSVSGSGTAAKPRCGWLRVESVSGDTLILEKDITISSTSGLNIIVWYYPFTINEIYLSDVSDFSAGDYIDYNHDGVPRIISGIGSDANGNKIILSSGSAISSGVRPSSICNWKTNTNLSWDLRQSPSSLSINNAAAHAAYDTFFNLYGIDIKKDIVGITRPQGSFWDIGAYEYKEGSQGQLQQDTTSPSISGGGGGGGGGGSVISSPVQIKNLTVRELEGGLVAENSTTQSATLFFEAQVFDADNHKVRLEVELKKGDEQFTGSPTFFSEYVDSGKTVYIVRGGLINGFYRFKARTRRYSDSKTSDWLWFGTANNTHGFTLNSSQTQVSQIYQSSQSSTTTKPQYYFKSNLYLGLKNNIDVESLQKVLNSEGVYPENIASGNFGPLTKKATIAFQKKYNISPAVGYVGPLTRAKLNELYAGTTVSTTPAAISNLIGPFTLYSSINSGQVKILQSMLSQDKNIYPEGLITGYYGKLTVEAVKRFQIKYNIESIGFAGPKTRAKLNEVYGK